MQNGIAHFYNFFTMHRFDSVYKMKPNWHDDIEILFGAHGENTFLIDGNEVVLKKGDVFIINPRYPHVQVGEPNGYTITLTISSQFLISNGFKNITGTFKDKVIDDELWALLEKILDIYFCTNDFREVKMRILLLQLATYLFENYYSPNYLFGNNRIVNEIISYINDNFIEDITLNQLAQKFNYNKCYLATRFKRETGFTIMGYVNTLRCNYADSLLKSSTLKIKEISEMCGFSSVSAFNKTYKSIRKHAPQKTKIAYKDYLESGLGIGPRPKIK